MKLHNTADIALLLIRVGLALVFMAHGWDKVSTMPDTIGFFASLGLPAVVAYLVSYGELLGGLSMLVGVFTGWAGIFLSIIMLGAIAMVKLATGFLGGYELELMLFLSALAIALSGPGKYTAFGIFTKGE